MKTDFMRLPASEAERLCYAEGFKNAALLFARIADLEAKLADAKREINMLNREIGK